MPEYLAKYTTRAAMFDGGAFMPDPEPHYDEYRFEAETDGDAAKIAEEYKSTLGKEYFGSAITLDSLDQVKPVKVEPAPSATKQIKKVHFDEKLEYLVDEREVKYEGRRFRTVSAGSDSRSTSQDAENGALWNLESLATKAGADAYEIVSSALQDSKQEYDPKPWTAMVTAILYQSS